MYAIIQTGGKQYKVSPGDIIRVEKLPGEKGDQVELKEVLLFSDGEKIVAGKPLVANITITGEIQGQHRAAKVIIFKKKRRKGYSKKTGHRQSFTSLKIKEIALP